MWCTTSGPPHVSEGGGETAFEGGLRWGELALWGRCDARPMSAGIHGASHGAPRLPRGPIRAHEMGQYQGPLVLIGGAIATTARLLRRRQAKRAETDGPIQPPLHRGPTLAISATPFRISGRLFPQPLPSAKIHRVRRLWSTTGLPPVPDIGVGMAETHRFRLLDPQERTWRKPPANGEF